MEGLTYRAGFVAEEEERDLLTRIEHLPFQDVVIRGGVARRKVIHFGYDYDYEGWSIRPSEPPPTFLEPLILRCAGAAGVERPSLEQVMIARYAAGATIGWHRDAPMFGEPVIGVSLGAPCTMRFRRKQDDRWQRETLELEPRSLYILAGAARKDWQHSIPPVPALRYSITFRVVRRRKTASGDRLRPR